MSTYNVGCMMSFFDARWPLIILYKLYLQKELSWTPQHMKGLLSVTCWVFNIRGCITKYFVVYIIANSLCDLIVL